MGSALLIAAIAVIALVVTAAGQNADVVHWHYLGALIVVAIYAAVILVWPLEDNDREDA